MNRVLDWPDMRPMLLTVYRISGLIIAEEKFSHREQKPWHFYFSFSRIWLAAIMSSSIFINPGFIDKKKVLMKVEYFFYAKL